MAKVDHVVDLAAREQPAQARAKPRQLRYRSGGFGLVLGWCRYVK